MNALLKSCLYQKDRVAFDKLRDDVRQLNVICNGNNIVQDDIFNVIRNYSRKIEQPIEVLRYPINDDEFCACTFIREGIVFVVINSKLSLSKQIFAAAHELYHIYCYVQGENPDYYSTGSILKSDVIDETVIAEEDMKANAFAGLFLAPKEFLSEQIGVYGIKMGSVDVKGIIQLMDIFAIPYKAVVLRLYEDELVNERKADDLLSKSTEEINKLVVLTGISRRWQTSSEQVVELGSIEEKLSANTELGFLTEERSKDDSDTLKEIKTILLSGVQR